MSDKFLYIFGAGASANCFPITKDRENVPGLINSMLTEFPAWIDKLLREIQPEPDRQYVNFALDIIKSVAEAAAPFGDVDTYAKFLRLKSKHQEFYNVKFALSYYFSIRQAVLKHYDDRYLRWLIGIMNDSQFPENVRVINWNYDFQVELASCNFGDLESRTMSGSQALGNVSYKPAFLSHFPSLDFGNSDRKYAVVHLNGIAGFFGKEFPNTQSVYDESDCDQSVHADPRVSLLKKLKDQQAEPAVHFAWEESPASKEALNKAKQMAEGTTIMVVIGYSFPFYNRKADGEIFKILTHATGLQSLKKIYYQDPYLNGQQLKEQFNFDNIQVSHITKTDNFHIPFEL